MVKIAFFDIDGTLVPFSKKELPDSTIAALDSLRSRGVKVFVSTGRPRRLISNLRDYPFDGYIMLNGSVARLCDEVIAEYPIDEAAAREVVRVSTGQGFSCAMYTADGLGINFKDDRSRAMVRDLHLPDVPVVDLNRVLDTEPAYQFTVYVNQEEFEKYYKSIDGIEWSRWNPGFVDGNPKGGSKGRTIGRVLSLLGIPKEESMAFGDGENDITMLDSVGLGVAMGNASDLVKSHAAYVTDDVESDGITTALRHFGLM